MNLREKAKNLEPIIRIGKNGITDSVVKEINEVLLKRKLIKVKFLKAALQDNDRKKLAQELAEKTCATLVESVGFVVVLYKGNV